MSLLESCIAAALILIATMIAVPSMLSSREDYELTAAAREVASQLRRARMQAITENRDCRLRVESPSAYLVECERSGWTLDSRSVLRPSLTITANSTPRFHRWGNASPTATISLWNSRGRSRRVIVNISGRVRME